MIARRFFPAGALPGATVLGAALALGACAGTDRYPSLAIRDAERATGTMNVAEAEPYVPPATPAEVVDRLAGLTAEARTAHQAFVAATDRARARAGDARGAEPGSEAWSVAQVALADLESSRSQAMIALADLDRLYVDARLEGAELDRIAAARDEVEGLVQAENGTLDALHGIVGS